MKNILYKIYAGILLIFSYPFFHLEEQIRELGRAYRNWKPKYAAYQSHERWHRWWNVNIKDKQ